jgi:hypothetical protein
MLAYHTKWSRKTGKVILTLMKLVPIKDCMLKMICAVPLLLWNCSFRKLIQLQLLFSITAVKMLCRPKHRTMNIFGTQINPSKLTNSVDLMADISKNASCSMRYTAHCLRATAIQGMSDAGFEIRHIMYMSGHRNESSVRSYYRSCSTMQKESLSDTLSSISAGRAPTHSNRDTLAFRETSNARSLTALSSNNCMSSGFISNSSFNNCTIQFTNPQN